MSNSAQDVRVGRVEFTGSRHELLGIILRGYALMIPTIGLYRFWQATWKRRFYWQNTVIDGEPIEYTGNARQLLLGFLFALAFFVPIYIALFVLALQDAQYLVLGYLGIGAAIWFLMGYGIYRGRDFRFSRTLWRGVRFDVRGNAWAYALRRFLWSILMLITLGLVYPFMASSLWRYRWRNTWYGDRKFEISGNWLAFAWPYYASYFLNLFTIAATTVGIVGTKDYVMAGKIPVPGTVGLIAIAGCIVIFALSLAWYRTRSASRMLSTVTVGEATLTVRIPTSALIGQWAAYIGAVITVLILLGITTLIALGFVVSAAGRSGHFDQTALLSVFQSSTLNVVGLIVVYLIVLGTFGLLSEVILGFGWWRLLARGATISNPDSLRSVRATDEDRSLVGQGLADALNVGAY